MNAIVPTCLLSLIICALAVGQHSARPDISLFDYRLRDAPEITQNNLKVWQEKKVYDIRYPSPKGGDVTAYLVVPPRKGPFGAAIFLHGRGADRDQFLQEALFLADSNVVSLLIDAPASRPESSRRSARAYLEADRDIRVQTVIDIRRGIDLLLARGDVDSKRLAFIGYSAGGEMGGILAGVEKRLKACVIMTASGSDVDYWREPNNPEAEALKKRLSEERFELYVKSLEAVEPIRFIGHAASVALFFQFGRDDEVIPAAAAQKFYEAASQPKTVRWYKTGHSLNSQATQDRIKWVIEKVGRVIPPDR